MANGYLGKISAIVSANTADFDSKLSKSAAEVRKFASSMQGSLTAAQSGAAASLRGIYTDAQKLERALQAVATKKLSFKGFQDASLDAAVARMQALYSASSQINRPLSDAAKSFGKLSLSVQAEFIPALTSAQAMAEKLADTIETTGTASEDQFARVARSVDVVTTAIGRMKEASSLVSGLATGQELRFQRPEMVSEMQRSASLQSQAAQMSPQAINANGIASLVTQQRAAADETQRLAAALERESQLINGNVAAATAAYQSQLSVQRKLNDEIERRVGAEAEANKRAIAGAEAEIAVIIRRQQAEKAAEQERLSQSQKIADAETAVLIRRQQAGKAAEAERFAQLQKIAEQETSILVRRQQAEKQSEAERLAQIEKVAEQETAVLVRRQQAEKQAEAGRLAQLQKIAEQETAILVRRQQAEKQAEAERLSQIQKIAEQETAIFIRRQQAEKEIEQQRLAELQKIADAELAVFIRRQQADKQAEAERLAQLEKIAEQETAIAIRRQQADKEAEASRLAELQRIEEAETAILLRRMRAEKDLERERIAQSQKIAEDDTARLIREQQAAKQAEQDRFAQSDRSAGDETALLIRREQAAKAAEGGGMTSLGLDIEDPRRQLGVLSGSITSLKGQIDTLPEPLRARFVPAIRDAEREFIRLSTAAAPVAGEIEAARQRLVQLTRDATRAAQAMNFRGSFGGGGMEGVNLGLDQRALQGYNAQLQILQGYMARIPGALAGPAIASFNQLRNAIAAAFDDGTINTAETRRELAALMAAATQTTASLAGVIAGRIGRDLQRAGDIGRGGFDNMSLAVNQAAFAIDDFMSSTGGLDQKLRAVSNNITQMAFILGGTTGLFVGLGAVIAGQAVVALIRWINNGRTAEDQTKALNEALARQKNLVEGLAEAFRSLGSSVTQNVFSEQAKQAKDFAREIENILKKQKELGLGRVAGNDVGVQRERAEQAKLKREIDKEEDPFVRAGKQRQLKASEEREQRKTRLFEVQPPPPAAEIRREIRLRAPVGFRNNANDVPEGNDVNSLIAQSNALQPAVDRLGEIVASGDKTFKIASRQLEVLGNLLDRVNRSIGDSIAQSAVNVADASRGPAEQIRQSQEEVANAIELGLPGARTFAAELQKSADLLQSAYDDLEKAQSEENTPAKKRKLVDAAQEKIDALAAGQAGMREKSDSFRYQRTVDPQQQIEARLERAKENLSAAGLEDGQVARRMREIENERETLRQRSAMPENQGEAAQQEFAKMAVLLNAEAAALEGTTVALKVFSDALSKASDEARGNLNSAQQAADEARRNDLGSGTEETRIARKRADFDLERQRKLERDAQREIENQRSQLEEIQQGRGGRRIAQINEQLKGGSLPANEQDALRKERDSLIGQAEDEIGIRRQRAEAAIEASTRDEESRKSANRGAELIKTPEERFAAETEQGLKDIRERFKRDANVIGMPVDEASMNAAEKKFKEDREKEARTATSTGRGREAFLTDRERFSRDTREGIARDMTAGAIDQAGVGNIQGRRALLEKGIKNQMEQVAPMLASFAQERQNARLQGPSRAALQMSDVSTSQGAAELTRLLRGDDSAKDVNLAELRKQTSKFDELIKTVREQNPGVLV